MEFSREELRLNLDKWVDDAFLAKIDKAYKEFEIEKKPIEYILWYVEFFGRKIKVNENTLIPRAETEYMIQWINEFIQVKNKDFTLRDIWTGSGVLWISVKLENKNKISKLIMTDISKQALLVAESNYENLIWNSADNNDEIIWSNLINFSSETKYQTSQDIILVANLPYIPDQAFEEWVWDTVKKREPKIAFVWWDDWLNYYREMFDQLFSFEKTTWNNKVTMFLEMMTWQVEILEKEFWNKLLFEEIKTFHFNIRIVKASFK